MAPFPKLRALPAPQQHEGETLPAVGDEELMLLTRAGHGDAFRVLVERYLTRVVSYCAKFTADAVAGEELAQDVFLQLWSSRERYRPQSPFTVFLFTITRNRCRNHRRWWQRLLPRLADAPHAAEGSIAAEPSQLEAMLSIERRRLVDQALGALPAKQREAVLLRFEQELSYEEIASVAGCPEATARTRVFHGMRELRSLLAKEEP